MPLDISDYLFPEALSVTPTRLRRVLFIGSCVAEQMAHRCKHLFPDLVFDLVMFNNVAELPQLSSEQAAAYDFAYLSLSLRDLLTDQVVDFTSFIADGASERVYEEAASRLEQAFAAAIRHNKDHGMLTFVANFLEPQTSVASALIDMHSSRDLVTLVRRLNQKLVELIRAGTNLYLADIESIAKTLGKSTFQDDMVMFYTHAGYFASSFVHYDLWPEHNPAGPRIEPIPDLNTIYNFKDDEYYKAVWRQAQALYRTVRQIDAVKLVIFDLDDTLWRGQIAEHYGDDGSWPIHVGWPLGIWEAIQHLRSRGILTGICSKNDEGLVRARWARGLRLLWVNIEDFTFLEIGWRPKAEAVASMIEQANLTPKSVVFVDDNPVEREAVKAALPEVRVIGSNPYVIRRVLLWSSETQLPILTKESITRNEMMKGQKQRELSRAALSREEFLKDLHCKVHIGEVAAASGAAFVRGLELINKTNQFNTTGERFSHQQMVEFFRDGGTLYVFTVEDRFTKYGLVGAIRVKGHEFLQFAMSCRVLGLDIETSMIAHIMHKEGRKRFSAQVKETSTNMVCRNVFERSGFSSDETGSFWIDYDGAPGIAPHLTLEDTNEVERATIG